ncbi:uncharacterized protein RCC_07704 [Ramularia collo-cygni]|uniref:BTB domain-containing protein n=1 Tax=Ramularia collo-cygni TaxID=112498 RepID=A0A2D3VAM1_9PEZI|nr:uncharacterized protein RCC_07704 [Ramularia collo-cygni]CZT21837.1 uncharacterized protein RCC_07704 [Ramularia collo-cygni]
MADETASRRWRFHSEIVTVKIGQNPTENFFIHEGTLKQHSDFFKAAMDKKWKEGQSMVIELPEDKSEVFSHYADWLYCGVLSPVSFDVDDTEGRTLNKASSYNDLLAEMYVFGEKFLNPRFCDAVMCAMCKNAQYTIPDMCTIEIIYNGTNSTSPVRRYLVEYWLSQSLKYGELTIYEDEEDRLHPQFAIELLRAFMTQPKKGAYYWDPGSEPRKAWLKVK